MPRVVVFSNDFRLAYKVRVTLEVSEFDFEHLIKEEKLRPDDIVIQSPKDRAVDHPRRIVIRSESSSSGILASIYRMEEGGGHLVVGIDPGKTIGVGILFNGHIVASSSFEDLVRCERWIRKTIAPIRFNRFEIKIGNGGGRFNEETFDYMFKQFSSRAVIVEVDENGSSKEIRNKGRTRHENAAIVIAGRRGRPRYEE